MTPRNLRENLSPFLPEPFPAQGLAIPRAEVSEQQVREATACRPRAAGPAQARDRAARGAAKEGERAGLL
jgi:hypothetical protein